MADCDLVLFFDVAEEWTIVVDAEGEDTVLIGDGELGAVDSAVLCSLCGLQVQAVEGGEHGEFELEGIQGGHLEGDVMILVIFGNFNVEDLCE